jgi:hypothetical protein
MADRSHRQGFGVLGIGAAACAACCAGPVIAFLAAASIGTLIGIALFGVAGIAVAVIAGFAFLRAAGLPSTHPWRSPSRMEGSPVSDRPKLIPIYDDTAAVACTITNAEIPERLALLERMRAAMTALDRTTTGLLLHFPGGPDVRADLATFVVDEKRCCQFWGFELAEEPGGFALRWDGPPAVDALLDQLEMFLTTDAPISALEGML